MGVELVQIGRILTRTCGFLGSVVSHSLQPYRGCAFGKSLCGVGCYARHNWWLTRGRPWGEFVEVRTNAPQAYRKEYPAERTYAHRRGKFGIFLSSSTEPFQPAEQKHRITQQTLQTMVDLPPDVLIVQSHSHHMADCAEFYVKLAKLCDLRLQLSIETDLDRIEGLPPFASGVEDRIEAIGRMKQAGLKVTATVAPLLPIHDPERFFRRLKEVADGVIIDHFIDGDGSPHGKGARTLKTPLPLAMSKINPESITLEYRENIAAIARKYFPGKVGVNAWG